jgi:hypothetical protein
MRRTKRIAESDTAVIIHQRPATSPMATMRRTPTAVGHAQVVNRPTPAAAAHPADVRPHVNHLNRGPRREEVGTRRTDDIKRLQARTALED